LGGEPKSTSTEIQWKTGMDLTKRIKDSNSQRRKRGFEPKNFFSWLADHGDPSSDDIAEVIKDDLWPNPLQYYLVPDIDGNGMDEDDSDEDGEDDEDEDAVVVVEEEDENDEDDDEAADKDEPQEEEEDDE